MNLALNNLNKIAEEIEKIGGISAILSKALDISNPSMTENTEILLNYGWYISSDIEMRKLSETIKLIKNDEIETAEKSLIEFYKKNIKSIEAKLISKHSERENIFKEAFLAHKNKMYYSSTILFLSQGDGMIDGKIFHNRQNLDKHLDKKRNPDFVSLLKDDCPLNVPSIKVKKSKYFSKLNRHAVMHGEDKNYGTEINSLKALSLCCFVSDWYNRY
ncbi:hypothetical protein H4V97_000241 [Flavobacterium sp. CG_23.5]|uniref:hypothetical protein n=1 Tax=unclassified Flavobacterium TaxID=196869 RepID=UPI0018CB5F8E|nr:MULTISPECIES: hypothetical protein [unclassified Flavobacterium]MBG6110080.1 hypothetical protein [Flavobacterium sp. CG_9.10]MBP2281923.1 hypothetical protein [Flavobacterium sp. CG_23.5]